MKRLTLLLLGLALGVTATARAQGLTMQMSNGWSFSFAGNVNAFWVFSKATQGGPTNSSVRTGLLPSFATFEARGDRKSTRLNSSHSQISYAVFCLKKKKQSIRDNTSEPDHSDRLLDG